MIFSPFMFKAHVKKHGSVKHFSIKGLLTVGDWLLQSFTKKK